MALVDEIVKECLFKARGRDWLFFGNLAEYLPTVESRLGGGGGGGVLSPENGGTGQTTLNAAIAAMLPSQNGNSGKVLGTNGSGLLWVDDETGSDIPSQTGQSGKVLGTDGTNLQWVVDQVGEGEGETLPPQTGHEGEYLTTDGTNLSWAEIDIPDPLPTQTGQAGKVLGTDGTDPSWVAQPTVATLLPAQTGQSGKILGTNGTVLSWVDQATGGGTSLPAMTGNADKVLTNNGTVASWTDYKPFAIDEVTGLQNALDGKVSIASPGVATVYRALADTTNDAVSFVDIPISLPVVSGRLYQFEFVLVWSGGTDDSGIGIQMSGPTNSLFSAAIQIFGAGASGFSHAYAGNVVNFATQVLAGDVNVINTKYLIFVKGVILPTADGNVVPQFRTEVAAAVATIYTNSFGTLMALT